LSSSVEILLDRWGVPHVYASSRDDLFIAQGSNAARDRLFQIDLWRRRGLGLLSEVFGEAYGEQDRGARLFLYRGDMHAEWLAYGSDTKLVTSAFVRGINAFVALCRQDGSVLPPEFTAMDYLPEYWESADVARIRSHGIFSNLEQEPAHELRVPEGLDLSVIPDDVLRVYHLATNTGLGAKGPSGLDGSNNWVLGPSRTASGRPLLANDPHRAVTLPALRYIAHLSSPDLDVIGTGVPDGYPHMVTHDWDAPFWHERIAEELGSRTGWTVEDCVRLQTDYVSLPARRIQPLLSGLTSDDAEITKTLDLLRRWDATLSADSGAAALFEVWYRRHLRPAVLDAAPTIADAVAEVEGLLGGADSWAWGRLHQAEPRHPLGERGPSAV
jgi:acyl-homoserine lactone acylase PvdQ